MTAHRLRRPAPTRRRVGRAICARRRERGVDRAVSSRARPDVLGLESSAREASRRDQYLADAAIVFDRRRHGAFAVALALRCIPSPSGKNCRWAWIGVAGVVAWTTWQATPLLARGFRQRWSEEATRRNYLPSNLDLTSTSYAFGGAPPSFVTGVMDPLLEFQFVGADGRGLPS